APRGRTGTGERARTRSSPTTSTPGRRDRSNLRHHQLREVPGGPRPPRSIRRPRPLASSDPPRAPGRYARRGGRLEARGGAGPPRLRPGRGLRPVHPLPQGIPRRLLGSYSEDLEVRSPPRAPPTPGPPRVLPDRGGPPARPPTLDVRG